jgi:hypothetical protein
LKDGHAHVSYGPLIFPRSCSNHDEGDAREALQTNFKLGSVAGLKQVQLIGDGLTAATRTFVAHRCAPAPTSR